MAEAGAWQAGSCHSSLCLKGLQEEPPSHSVGLITCGSRSLWFRTSACSSLEGCQFSHSCQMSWQCCTWNTRLSTLKGFVYKRRKYTYVFGRSMCRVLVIVLVWILFFFSKIQSTQRHTLPEAHNKMPDCYSAVILYFGVWNMKPVLTFFFF